MTNTYAKAYTEVIEILSHFSDEEYEKIPRERIEYYENNMDKDYIFNIDPDKELSEQNISQEANAIMISLFRDYFADEVQKKNLNHLLNQNQQTLEKEKRKKYNPENLFKDKKDNTHNEVKEELALMEIKNENWYEKIFSFFKSILKR